MTATVWSADAPFGRHTNWKSINWRQVRDAVRRLQVRIAKAVTKQPGGPIRARLNECLSRMTGNYHARFLGGLGLSTAPGYPVSKILMKGEG